MIPTVIIRGLATTLVLLSAWAAAAAGSGAPRLREVRKIWDAAPHNAFTDLIRHGGQWFCVFREGQGHVSPEGAIRVLVSPDTLTWRSAARLESPEADLRDPKITVTPQGQLMLTAAGAWHRKNPASHQTFAWFSADGQKWTAPVRIGEPDYWLWRVTWQGATAYGVGYHTAGQPSVRLYQSSNGRDFSVLVPEFFKAGEPNETSIVFEPDGTAICLLRRDGAPGSGQIGRAAPPYTEWDWKDLQVKIGGPHLLRLSDGRFIAAIRLYDQQVRTALAWVEPKTGKLTEFLPLPSSGDSSYPGLVWHEDKLWVSYYSSHEGKTSIYLAQVELSDPPSASSKIAPYFTAPPSLAEDLGSYRSPLLFREGQAARSASDWKRRRAEIFRDWQELMGAWPPLLEKPTCEVLSTEARDGFTQQRVRVEIAPGETVEGWLLIPPGAGPFPAVVIPYYEPETSAGLSKQTLRDFGLQLTQRGFVTLSIGSPGGDARKPAPGVAAWQPLSYLAYVAANCHTILAQRADVAPDRIGVVGHSYGGKWALFAAALHEKFAAVAVSDPGIVFDESRPNVNYWEPWYLGRDSSRTRKPGVVTAENPRTGAYAKMVETGRDLHELMALISPRPFLVSGGSEDPPERWRALNHLVAINRLLGFENRVGMSNRPLHTPTDESNAIIYAFFEHFLRP